MSLSCDNLMDSEDVDLSIQGDMGLNSAPMECLEESKLEDQGHSGVVADEDKNFGGPVSKSFIHLLTERKIGHRRVTNDGEITYKKILTSQIMASIQLGIQYAVGAAAAKKEADLLMQDFMAVESTSFPSHGSDKTPEHSFGSFRFRSHAPLVFRYFRALFGIRSGDYAVSMCGQSLRELTNPGASGSIFYVTADDEFIVKTVQHKESGFLVKLLPGYYMNINQNPRTLLPKFFGLYCYQCNSKNVRLLVMNNLLPSCIKIHQRYDLKGSTFKRRASKQECKKESPTFKDLDFLEHHPEGIGVESTVYAALIKTIERDCRVLESFKIIDYSLLVGIHNLDQAERENVEVTDVGDKDRLTGHPSACKSVASILENTDQLDDEAQLGGIPARNAAGERLLLFLGIIDILQNYRLRKKLEHTFKSIINDGSSVSVHSPGFYSKRFQRFITTQVFHKTQDQSRVHCKKMWKSFVGRSSAGGRRYFPFSLTPHPPSAAYEDAQRLELLEPALRYRLSSLYSFRSFAPFSTDNESDLEWLMDRQSSMSVASSSTSGVGSITPSKKLVHTPQESAGCSNTTLTAVSSSTESSSEDEACKKSASTIPSATAN